MPLRCHKTINYKAADYDGVRFQEIIIEIIYILFGWLLGLLSPTIVGSIKQRYVRKKFFEAAKRELSELQFQLCITGMLLAQRFGDLDRDYLNQVKSILDNYDGGEKPQNIGKRNNNPT